MTIETGFEDFIRGDDAAFHYTSMASAFEHILPRQTLRLSSLQKMDDPQEYNSWMYGMVGWSLPETAEVGWSEASRSLNQVRKEKSFVGCFCGNSIVTLPKENELEEEETAPQYGYMKSRMWSQYGDHHRGVCLVFSKQELRKFAENSEKMLWPMM